MKSLQYLFVETKGKPVQVGDYSVRQSDQIPIAKGAVRVTFLSPLHSGQCEKQGVLLNAGKGGTITLTDGSTTQRLKIWHEDGLPTTVEHAVNCPSGQLSVCNIYAIRHTTGKVTEDHWTGNAGLVVLEDRGQHRRYGCSDGLGPFDPIDFEFELEWQPIEVLTGAKSGKKSRGQVY